MPNCPGNLRGGKTTTGGFAPPPSISLDVKTAKTMVDCLNQVLKDYEPPARLNLTEKEKAYMRGYSFGFKDGLERAIKTLKIEIGILEC